MTRQAFYKYDDESLFRRLATEQFVVQYVREIRETDSRHNLPTYPNLVKNVIPERPNQIWVSDITYIPIEDPTVRLGYRFCFLSIIMDAYSKRIMGWCVAPTLSMPVPTISMC